MATIVTRSGKGSPLSIAEGDANFTNLNNDKIELDDISISTASAAETSALSYNNSTGVLTFTPVVTSDLIGLTDIGVTTATASGGGALSYDNTTGAFTFTPPDLSSFVTSALSNVVEDTTPQLGGNLDVQSSSITTSTTNGNITLTPNGTGLVVVDGALRVTNGSHGNISVDVANGNLNLTSGSGTGAVNIQSDVGLQISGDGTDAQIFTAATNSNLTLFANGTGAIICDSNVDVGANTIKNGETNGDLKLSANGTGKITLEAGTGIDLKSANLITTSTSNTDIDVTANGTGYVNLNSLTYLAAGIEEEVNVSSTTTGTYAPAASDGSIHYVVLSGNMTINAFSNPVTGQTITLAFNGTGGSYTLTLGGDIMTPGGSLALTDGGFDIVTITCLDDTTPTYIATAVNNFQ
jgi:hypothetical protein